MSQIYISSFFSNIGPLSRILLNLSADYHKAITPHTLAREAQSFPQGFSHLRGKARIGVSRRMKWMFKVACLPLLFSASSLAQPEEGEKLAPYYPTPETIVDKMLQLGGLKAGERVYDLGSGDGRIVIMAAEKFHADAIGIELDKDLCKLSMDRIRKLHLEKNAHIVNGDLLKQNYSSADLVTVYLFPGFIDKVQPLLDQQLKKGARVVAHDFEFKNWTPDKVQNIADDGAGRSHTLYLYRK
jgi:16S rRNA G966 N2-methylase RsmD